MAEAFGRRPLAAKALVRCRVRTCNIYCRQSGTGTGVYPNVPVLPYQYHSIASYSSLFTCFFYQDKRAKRVNVSKSCAFSEIGKNWIEEYFILVFKPLNNQIVKKPLP